MRYKILPLMAMLLALLLAACTAEGVNDGDPVSSDMQGDGGVQMVVVADALPSAEDGSSGGHLELNITFENPTEQEVTLNLSEADYVLTTNDGIELTPSQLSDELRAMTIPAGGSVSGEAQFAVLSPISTFTFNVEGFEPVTVDASVDQGLEAESRG